VTNSASGINPAQDQDLFIDYNIRPFTAPADFVFEPSGVHYDTPEMSVEPSAKVFLQNKLAKTKAKLRELESVLDTKREAYLHT
jgi:formin-binding protein 1